MPASDSGSSPEPIPAWALQQATARQAQEREDERHDEYDDPDQGGEA
jgi:hypothetical protein